MLVLCAYFVVLKKIVSILHTATIENQNCLAVHADILNELF